MGISRLELFTRLGRVRIVEPMLALAHVHWHDHQWRTPGTDHHGRPWRGSFRGSQFPGDSERPCPRQLVYWMMDIPEVKPISRDVHGTAIVGQAVEDDDIAALGYDGRVLSTPQLLPQGIDHLGFEDGDHWLTATPDIVVLPYRWNRPHVVEVKTKDRDVVSEMQNLARRYDPGHRQQALVNTALLNEIMSGPENPWPSAVVCTVTWQLARRTIDFMSPDLLGAHICPFHGTEACLAEIELEPPTTCSVIYHMRERPHATKEWFFELPPGFMERGRAVLREAKEHFERGEIPPHPFGGKQWSELPCKYCDFKKFACKPDCKVGVTEMDDSHGIEFAQELRPNYTLEAARQAVRDQWDGKTGVQIRLPVVTTPEKEEIAT